MKMQVCFTERMAYRGGPAGITVSKRAKLPDGDFGITEYRWGDVSLWFLDMDRFTEAERQAAYVTWMNRARYEVGK